MKKHKKTVLIADQDANFVDQLTAECQEIGMNVVSALDARTALSNMLQSLPDLICIEANMEAGNGLTVCQVLEQDDEASRIPVIAFRNRDETPISKQVEKLCVYEMIKTDGVARRIEPIVHELVDLLPSKSTKETA